MIVRLISGGLLDATNGPVIHRCFRFFAEHTNLILLLCAGDQEHNLYLDGSDLEMFSRTILPALVVGAQVTEVAGETTPQDGLGAQLPEELLELKREPCGIEMYMDRDGNGISCDLQARYGDRHFHVFDGPGPSDGVLRDQSLERLAMEAVRQYFPRPKNGPLARIKESDDKAIYKLLAEGLPVLRGLGQIFSTPAFDGLSVVSHTIFKAAVSVKSGLVEISPIADEIDPKDVPALLSSYHKRRSFHRLRNGAFVNLAQVGTSRIDELASDLGLKAESMESGGLQMPAYGDYFLDKQVDDNDKDASFQSYLRELQVIDPDTYQLPEKLTKVLRPYQVEGFRWLNAVRAKGFGGILADEMGLGKTVELLAFLESQLEQSRKVGPSVIVCPASLVYNWQAECAKFVPDMRVSVVAGNKAERRALLKQVAVDQSGKLANGGAHDMEQAPAEARAAYDLLITSYDLLRRDVEDYRSLVCYCIVLDEAQYIKNHATKVSQAVRHVRAHHRFALTGTPIENRLSELWSVFDFLMPGMLGSYAHFRERFEMPVLSGERRAESKLQALVGPFILRRLKADVLKDFPEKIENVITVPLEGEQRKLYAALEQRLRATLNKQGDIEFNTGKIQVLAQLTKMRQVCCDPRLLYTNVGQTDQHEAQQQTVGRSSAR